MNRENTTNYPSGAKELGVELLSYGGGDKTHSISAWQSTYKELGVDMPNEIDGRVDLMFGYLAKAEKEKVPKNYWNISKPTNTPHPLSIVG